MAIWSNFGPNLTSLNMGHASSAADIRFGLKVGQVGSKWDNSGDFSRSDSVHFDSVSVAAHKPARARFDF